MGWKTQQMVAGLEPTVNLATAANTDLGTTCDIVTDALTAFGMQAEDTSHFTDIIASASSNANTNVEMLGESFKYVAPLCGSLKFSAEDAAIALGLMANSGIKSSQAGTSLKTALTNMISPTDTMAVSMAQYGISVTDAEGNMKSLREIMDMLRTNMKSLSDEQINSNFEKYSKQIGMTRKEFEALGEDVQANILAETVGSDVTKNWSAEQMQSALAARFTKKELSKMTLEQQKWQLACMEGQIAMYGLTEAEQAEAASNIFGKEAMAGMLSIINASETDYNKLTNAIDNCDGVTKEMADTMANSTQGKIDSFKSKCEALGIKIADGLLPHVNDLLDKGMELITWFSNLDEGTQQAIVKFGLLTFATGGVLTAVGKATTNVGGLVTWVGKLTKSSGESATTVGKLGGALGVAGKFAGPLAITIAGVSSAVYLYNKNQDALNNTVITSKEEMGNLEAALLSLKGIQVSSRKELESQNLVYKDFNENVSEDFKKSVQEASKEVHNFSIKLGEMSLDGVLDDDETTEFNQRISDCVKTALDTISSKKEEAQEEMRDLFTFDGSDIDSNEQAIIDLCNREYEVEAEEVRKNQDLINDIYNTARKEGRALKPEEIQNIKKYYAQIKQIELECKAENRDELDAAEIDFQNRAKALDLKGATELLTQKKKQLDELLIQKENEYDLVIKKATEGAEELKGKEKENALEKIELLKNQKEKCIEQYQSEWDKYKEIIDNENPNIVGKYNEFTGEILSDADIAAQKELNIMTSKYANLNQITEDGWYRIYNTSTGNMENLYVNVDENTGKIIGCWSDTASQCGASSESMAQSTKQLADETSQDLITMINLTEQHGKCTVDAKNQVVDAYGQVIGTLENVKGKQGEVQQGIININGTPMQIVTNADGVIVSMHKVSDSMDETSSSMDNVSTAAENSARNVQTSFSNAANNMPSIGRNIVQGIINGINSSSGSLTSTMGRLGASAKNAAQVGLKIHSPSRVMRDEVGVHIPTGIIAGINKTKPELMNYTKKMALSILDTAKDNTNLKDYKTYGSDIVSGIKDGFDSKQDEALKSIETFVDKQVETLKKKYPKAETDYSAAGKSLVNTYKEALKNGFDDAYSTIKDSMDKITQEAQNQYNDIIKMQESMQSKLSGFGDLYSVEDDDMELSDIGDQIAVLEEYENKLNKLKTKKVSDDFISQVTNMDVKTAVQFMDKLYELDEDEFNHYVNSWNNKQLKAKEIAEEFYKGQLSTLQNNFTQDLNNAMSAIPTLMKDVGTNAAQGMLNGLTEEEGKLIEKCNGLSKKMINTFQSAFDIHSPSRIMRDLIGRNIVKGINTGIDDEFSNLETGLNINLNSLIEDFKDVFQNQSMNIDFSETGLGNISNSLRGLLNTDSSYNIDIARIKDIKGINSNLALSGEYYNRDSIKSQQLISNNTINNYNSSSQNDYGQFINAITNAIIAGLSNVNINNNFDFDKEGIINTAVERSVNKIDRTTKNKKASKGRIK